MGSTRGAKRGPPVAPSAQQQQPSKRLRTSPHEDGSSSGELDLLQMLPPELIHVVVGNLTPRECQPLRLTCKGLRDIVNVASAETLTVTNDIAQYLVLEQGKQYRIGAGHVLSTGWVARFLAKFPRIKKLDVKCSQNVLTLFARHMVRDSLGSVPPGALPLSRIFDLAENVKTNSRRHSAVLLCELIKLKVAQSLTSKPPGYDAMRQDVKQYVRADQLLNEHRIELQARVVELVEKVLTLKGHVDARAHENYKYARDTLDDSLLQMVSCLQPRHSKYAYQLLAKAADPAKAARGWRWLFYFLARQKQAEAAIEAYKVVDKQALATLSPTCLSELFRSLIDNEITTQPEPKLRAITSESGSWTKFLYRGNFTLTSTQSREGALEKVAADLVGKDYLDTAVNVMNRFETEGTANDIWVQLLGALGIVPGGEMPLVSRDLHTVITEQATKASALAMQALAARRVSCHVPLVDLLVAEGHLDEVYHLVYNYPEQGALDKHLLRALCNNFALADCPPGQISSATCALLLDVLKNRLRDVAAKSELTTILVAAYAARRELGKAVELASSLDAAAAAAMDADAGAAGGPAAEPVPAAAAQGAAAGAAGAAEGAAGAQAGDAAGAGGDGAGTVAGLAGQRLAAMWRGVAAAAIRQGEARALLTALPRVQTTWLLGPADEDCGPEEVPLPLNAQAGPSGSDGKTKVVPTAAVAAAATAAGPSSRSAGTSTDGATPTDAAAAEGSGGGQGQPATPAGPSTVWQRVCGVLLRAGRRSDLESALVQLLGERRRGLGGHTDQRALLESTARAMLGNGCVLEAMALARRLGGGYTPTPAPAACGGTTGASAVPGTAASPASAETPTSTSLPATLVGGVRPCWSMLNVMLEGLMAAGQVEAVLRELLAAGAAQAKTIAATAAAGPGGASDGTTTSAAAAAASASLVLPAAAGRLRQALLTDVLSALTDAGRLADAIQLLRALRGGENDGPLLPPHAPLPTAPPTAAVQRTGSGAGRAARPGRAGASTKRNRAGGAAATMPAAMGDDGGVGAELATALAAEAAGMIVEGPAAPGGQADTTAATASTEQANGPQPQYSRLMLEGSGDEEAGQASGAGAAGAVAGNRQPSGSGCGAGRAASLEAALAALVKALQKRAGGSNGNGGSATNSGSSAGAAGSAGGGGSTLQNVELLADWLEVCKAWPLGPSRDAQLDALARRAMDKGRDLDVALQAGWLLGEASPQELRFAFTHRDLAQKCISQGMLEAAQACLLRVKPQHWEDAGDVTARELMRAVARSGDKPAAMQLAAVWIPADDQRAEFVKTLRAIRPTVGGGAAGGGGGSRAGSSSRGSSRD